MPGHVVIDFRQFCVDPLKVCHFGGGLGEEGENGTTNNAEVDGCLKTV
jgi:hypothetical protein